MAGAFIVEREGSSSACPIGMMPPAKANQFNVCGTVGRYVDGWEIGRQQRIAGERVLDVGEDQLLVLLLVMEP